MIQILCMLYKLLQLACNMSVLQPVNLRISKKMRSHRLDVGDQCLNASLTCAAGSSDAYLLKFDLFEN